MPATVAVVGASVRGTIALDRIRARASKFLGDKNIDVVVVDPHTPGAGRIWREDQPASLVMNTLSATTTVFTDAASRVHDPADPAGPTVYQWCRSLRGEQDSTWATLDDLAHLRNEREIRVTVREEAERLRPWDYPSRALFGAYLLWAWDHILRHMPPTVTVRHLPAEVVDITTGEGPVELALSDGGRLEADAVVLAVGWGTETDRDLPSQRPLTIAGDSPIDQGIDRIEPGETVLVRGLGMNFFDLVSLVTEGRGGRFTENADGTLRYEPSGAEPRIVAGSRRGLPFRAQLQLSAPPTPADLRATRAAIAAAPEHEVVFARDIRPALDLDARRAFYTALAADRLDLASGLQPLLDVLEPSDTAPADEDIRRADELAARCVGDPSLRFVPESLLNPLPPVSTWSEYEGWAYDYLSDDAARAARGTTDPLKAGMAAYTSARPLLGEVAAFGRLTPESYLTEFRPFLRFVGIAGGVPPLFRVRQLLALLDAGIVRLLGPDFTVERSGDEFVARAPSLTDGETTGTVLVDAYMPAPGIAPGGLLGTLADSGLARRYTVGDTTTSSLDVDAAANGLVCRNGTASDAVFSLGIPSEDVRVFTIIAPIPNTDSAVLREADAAVAAALTRAADRVAV